ncbi:hypothetical protein PLEOSDRAFT_1090470, partial [Pleurotus ostreatus PC15]
MVVPSLDDCVRCSKQAGPMRRALWYCRTGFVNVLPELSVVVTRNGRVDCDGSASLANPLHVPLRSSSRFLGLQTQANTKRVLRWLTDLHKKLNIPDHCECFVNDIFDRSI